MSDIKPGDVVIGIDPRDCPLRISHVLFDVDDGAEIGKVFRVAAAWTEHGHPMISFGDDWDHCAGCFRKIEPGKMEFTALTERVKEGEPA